MADGRRIPVKYLSEVDIIAAMIPAKRPAQTRSGLFLINRSIIMHAGKVSPKKVRLDQIYGLIETPQELILRNRDLLIPDRKTIANPIKKRMPRVRLVL
jgi:hypothetical protein